MFRRFIYPGYVRLSRVSRNASRRTSERGGFIQTGAVISAAIGVDTDLTLIYQLFAFLLCIIVVSRLAVRYQKPKITLLRRLPQYATVGEAFSYPVLVTNMGDQVEQDLRLVDNPRVIAPDFPHFDAAREPGEDSRNAYDRWIGFHRFIWLQRLLTGITVKPADLPNIHRRNTVEGQIEATPLRRGIVHFTSTTLLHPDPLGLNYGLTHFDNPEQLMILPRRYAVSDRYILPVGRNFQPGGVNPTWSIGDSEEFVSLREYRDGDSVRKIHWPSSAKRSKPVVREYQDEFFIRHALVLDTLTSDNEVLEEAIAVAASLVLKMQDSDGLLDLLFLSASPNIITTGRGFAQLNQQLAALATLESSDRPFAELKNLTESRIKRMSGCYLVLTQWDEERESLVNLLQARDIPVTVFLLTALESALWSFPEFVTPLPVHDVASRLAS